MTLLYNNKIPKNRVVELEAPRFGLEGRFMVQLIRKVGDKEIIIRELPWQKNLIVDSGMNGYFNTSFTSGGGLLDYCAVGTGSTAPANGNTTLVSETGVRTNADGGITDVIQWGPANAYRTITRTRLFTETQSNGNLTEFGFFTASTAGTMFCRQLFKDGGGTPTTIVKTSSDQLRITYEVRLYPPTVDTGSTITISGTLYTWTGRALQVGAGSANWNNIFGGSPPSSTAVNKGSANESQTLAAISASAPAGTNTNASTSVWGTYVNGNFYNDITDKWEPGVANFATGIGLTVALGTGLGAGCFQTSWSPKFTKDNTKRLTLVTRIAWARH